MRMNEAMEALSSGQTADVRKLMGSAAKAPAGGGGTGGVSTQDRSERQVSLG